MIVACEEEKRSTEKAVEECLTMVTCYDPSAVAAEFNGDPDDVSLR